MTQRKYWQVIYALTLVLVVSRGWADEKKAAPSKPATAPKCCYESAASACGRCCEEQCSSCNSPSSTKLVTRIHPLAGFFEASEQMEQPESAVSTAFGAGKPTGKCNLEDQLIKLITNHIQPNSWSQMGGQGTVDYYPLGKALVVSQKPEVQEQIARFLIDLYSLVDPNGCEEEEEIQCLPPPQAVPLPRAMVGVPMPMPFCYVPAPTDVRMERGTVPQTYVYIPAPPTCPVPPLAPSTYAPALEYAPPRPPETELLPAPRPAPASFSSMQQCVATQPAQCQTFAWVMRARSENGKAQLEMENCCMAVRAACESMELKTNGSESLKLTARESQIHIDAQAFRATADSLKCNGGSEWMLEGHVTLAYKKDGTSAQIRGDRLMLSMKNGQVQFMLNSSSAPTPPAVQPAAYLRSPYE